MRRWWKITRNSWCLVRFWAMQMTKMICTPGYRAQDYHSQGGHQFIWLVYDIASLRIPYVVRQSHEWLVNHHWLVVWNMIFIFPYIGNRNPNWRSHIFQRGRSTTNQIRASVYPMLGIGPAKNRSLAASTDNNRIKGDPVRSWFLLTHPQ
jgi:hypothetical protein